MARRQRDVAKRDAVPLLHRVQSKRALLSRVEPRFPMRIGLMSAKEDANNALEKQPSRS
jgi:hypothetical protein